MICVDTTALLELAWGGERAARILKLLAGPGATTAFNVWESLRGVAGLRIPEHRRDRIARLTRVAGALQVIPITLEDAVEGARVTDLLAGKGLAVGHDALVAAAAVRGGCDGVLTENVKHFQALSRHLPLKVVGH